MKQVLMILAILLLAGSVSGQVVIIDSVTIPTINSYDSTLGDYRDSLTVYSMIDTSGVLEQFVMKWNFSSAGVLIWTTGMTVIDSGDGWQFNPIVTHQIDPMDVNWDGRVSLTDIALLIHRLFIQ